jgi:internalin A
MSIRVFVSSTYSDLQAHRARVIDQLRAAGFHVDPMEDWPADATEPTIFCPERVRDCDLCILLVGFRRGWVPEGANRSITQMEYDEAIRLGIDVIPFLLADDVEGVQFDDRSDAAVAAVQAWRETLRPQTGNKKFHFRSDPASIDLPLAGALSRWQQRQKERERLADYLRCVADAHKTINFLGLPTFKENPDVGISDLFVEPALATQFASPDRDPKEWVGVTSLFDAVSGNSRLIVLGDPGTGKSTLVSWGVYQLARDGPSPWKARLGDPIPLPFILRDLGVGRDITWDALLDKFLAGPAHHNLKKEHLLRLLEAGDAMFFLDGLDEIGDVKIRQKLRGAVHEGLEQYPLCRWLLTSRIVGYDEVRFQMIPNPESLAGQPEDATEVVSGTEQQVLDVLYATPFDDPRIAEFARKWYAVREVDPYKVRRHSQDLVEAICRDPDTLRLGRIPNLLTMMALVHRVKATLPHGKALLYDYVAEAYLETIDHFRQLPADADSLRDKKRWLGRVAFEMQLRRAKEQDEDEQANAIVVDRDTLRSWLGSAMTESGRPPDPDDPARFLDRVRKRSGLMIERSLDRFAFTHLSFQEYFAAVYLKERIATPTWLRGKGVAAGAAPTDLQGYAREPLWQVALVFLFELIAEEAPDWKDDVREAVFGKHWEVIDVRSGESAPAVLLAKLAVDPHVRWESDTRTAAQNRCLEWELAMHEELRLGVGAVLRVFLSGDSVTIAERLGTVARHWAAKSCTVLTLSNTAVADLAPLADLSELRVLDLQNTRVMDLGPLAGLAELKALDLKNSAVADLRPLTGLTGLQVLYLRDSKVADDEVKRLQARLPKLRIFR